MREARGRADRRQRGRRGIDAPAERHDAAKRRERIAPVRAIERLAGRAGDRGPTWVRVLDHHRRRFVTPEYLGPLARVTLPGAEFRVATDIPDYVRQTLEEVPPAGFDLISQMGQGQAWQDWLSTRYEQKALREGRDPHYLTFRRQA